MYRHFSTLDDEGHTTRAPSTATALVIDKLRPPPSRRAIEQRNTVALSRETECTVGVQAFID